MLFSPAYILQGSPSVTVQVLLYVNPTVSPTWGTCLLEQQKSYILFPFGGLRRCEDSSRCTRFWWYPAWNLMLYAFYYPTSLKSTCCSYCVQHLVYDQEMNWVQSSEQDCWCCPKSASTSNAKTRCFKVGTLLSRTMYLNISHLTFSPVRNTGYLSHRRQSVQRVPGPSAKDLVSVATPAVLHHSGAIESVWERHWLVVQ